MIPLETGADAPSRPLSRIEAYIAATTFDRPTLVLDPEICAAHLVA